MYVSKISDVQILITICFVSKKKINMYLKAENSLHAIRILAFNTYLLSFSKKKTDAKIYIICTSLFLLFFYPIVIQSFIFQLEIKNIEEKNYNDTCLLKNMG